MPPKLIWTDPLDSQLRRLRGDGASWDAIAAALAISRNAAIERGRRLGARLGNTRLPAHHIAELEAAYLRDPRRHPLPPGHAVSWGAITAGTCLADSPFTGPTRA